MADYEIPVVSDGEHVLDMLNAVKLMTQLTDGTTNGQFNSILATVGMIGLIVILINLVLRGNLQSLVQWLVAYALVFGVLFVPKVDVIVNDRSDPTIATNPVENVPLGVGMLAWITTSFGDRVAQSLETVMAPVDSVSYQGGNMLWGQKVMTEMPGMRFTSARVADNVNKYLRACVFPTVAADPEEMQAIKQSTDLWAHLASNAPSSRITEYTTSSGTTSFLSCSAAALLITPELTQEAQDALTFYGQRLYPDKDGSDAATALKTDLGTLHDTFIGVSRDGGEMLKQVMMLNQFEAGLSGYATDTASASLMNFVNSRAETQSRLTMAGMGSLMQTGVPRLYILMFIVLIALFPFIVAIGLIPGIGFTVVKNYVFGFVYLQSFPVLFIIINRIIVVENAKLSEAAAKNVTGSGISFQNMGILSEIPSETSAMAAVMLGLIPALSWIFTKGVASLSGQMENILRPMQVASESAAQEASTGDINVQAANINTSQMDSASGYQVQTSPSVDSNRSRYRDENGSWIATAGNGKLHVDSSEARSNLMHSPDVRETALQQVSQSRLAAQREEETATEAYTQAQERTRGQTMALAFASGMGVNMEETTGITNNRDVSRGLEGSRQELMRFAEDNNVSFEDLARAYARTTVGTGQDTGAFGAIFGTNLYFDAEAGAEGSGQARHAENLVLGEEFQNMMRQSSSLSAVEASLTGTQQSERFSKSNEFTEGYNDSLNTTEQASSAVSAASSRVGQLDDMRSRIESRDVALSAELGQYTVDELVDRYGEDQAARIASETSHNPVAMRQQRAAAEAGTEKYIASILGDDLVGESEVTQPLSKATLSEEQRGNPSAGFGSEEASWREQAGTSPSFASTDSAFVQSGMESLEQGQNRVNNATIDAPNGNQVGIDENGNSQYEFADPVQSARESSNVLEKQTGSRWLMDKITSDPDGLSPEERLQQAQEEPQMSHVQRRRASRGVPNAHPIKSSEDSNMQSDRTPVPAHSPLF